MATRIPTSGRGSQHVIPAEFIVKVAILGDRKCIQGSAGRDGKHDATAEYADQDDACKEDTLHTDAPWAGQGGEPSLQCPCTQRNQHWISRSDVIFAGAGEHEKSERDQVHPSEWPVTIESWIPQTGDEAGDDDGSCKQIDALERLP